jgi:hypothetical protein
MSYHRAVCALVLGAAVAAGWSEAAARTATSSITTTSSAALLDGPKHRKLGHCFLQRKIAAPHLATSDQSATLRAPQGRVVTRVSMKVGPECFFTPEGAKGTWTHSVKGVPCFVVEGLGTQAVTVRRLNRGSGCNRLSHLQMLSAAAPAPDAGNGGSTGGGSTGGGSTGGGSTGGGSTGGGTPGLGSLVVCTAATSAVGSVPILVSISTQYQEIALLEVPIGSCSEPMQFEESWYIVAQGLPEGWALTDVTTDPSGRIASVEAMYGQATVQVIGGSTTKMTFTNQVQ